MASKNIVYRYCIFATITIATIANLTTQELSIRTYTGFLSIYVGIFLGTLVGLMIKYHLDKQYIFFFRPQSSLDDTKTFVAYGLTGIGTTLLFWITEIGCELVYGSKIARYLGAIVGLSIGYVVKYQVDKRYVFS